MEKELASNGKLVKWSPSQRYRCWFFT